MFVVVVVVVVSFLAQVHSVDSIQCATCHSTVSWQDCDQRQTITNCSSAFDRCLTYNKTTPLTNGQLKHEYEKGCYHHQICKSLAECNPQTKEITQSRCSVSCCNATLCNAAVTQGGNEIKPVVHVPTTEYAEDKNVTKKTEPAPLFCYQCYSSSSWEDCIRNQKLVQCPMMDDACTSYHRTLTLLSGHQEHTFVKHCWALSDCGNEACRQTSRPVRGTWCDMRCCSSSSCNRQEFQKPVMSSQVMSSTSMTVPHGLLILTVAVLMVSSFC